jgi:penicillin-binding protein 1A
MRILLRLFYGIVAAAALSLTGLGLAAIGAYFYVAPSLPDVQSLREVRLQVPMRVYSRDGLLIAEFGEQRRIPVRVSDVPPDLKRAFLAAEDERFFDHPGVDWQGLTRAALAVAATGEPAQGGGTITMQVARNFFLTREKTISRKVRKSFSRCASSTSSTRRRSSTCTSTRYFSASAPTAWAPRRKCISARLWTS